MVTSGGSLQHMFENSLPESTTFLSSWNQIMPVKPIEHSSFTEIFGELHFKDPSSLSLSSEETDPFKHPESSNSFHRRSTSFSSTNSESLQLCTEGLGFESFDDVEDLKVEQECHREEDEDDDEDEEDEVSFQKNFEFQPEITRRPRSTNMEDFPPPIPCMGKTGKPWIGFKSYRYDGRFILKQVRVPTHEFLHASRQNGRLKLNILVEDDDNATAAQEDDEEEEEEEAKADPI